MTDLIDFRPGCGKIMVGQHHEQYPYLLNLSNVRFRSLAVHGWPLEHIEDGFLLCCLEGR